MKKTMMCIAAALLVCLSACTPRTEDIPTPVPAEEEGPAQGGILTDAGQAETLQDYYDRTAVISRNERIDGSFTETRNWALEYAKLEYPGRDVTVSFAGGFQAPRAMFRDELSAGVCAWEITVTEPSGDGFSQRVQVYYFTETADGVQQQCFSGLLAGEDMLESKPEAYAYLALDTRFASRMQKLQKIVPPEGALSAELAFLESAAGDCQAYPLTETAVAALSRQEDGSCALTLWDLEGAFETRTRPLEGIWNFAGLEDGVLTLEQYVQDGPQPVLEVRMGPAGPEISDSVREDGEDCCRVGGYTVTWSDGSLLLGDEVLLQGGAWDPEDVTTTRSYQFQQALDDHRFLYTVVGWEWVEGTGVYDLDTRTERMLQGDLGGFGYSLPIIRAEAGKALAGYLSEPGWWGLSLVDLERFEGRALNVGCDTEDAAAVQVEANGSLSRLALMEIREEQQLYRVRVCGTAAGQTLFSWDIPMALAAGQPEIRLVGENTLFVSLRQWATDTVWLYRVTY